MRLEGWNSIPAGYGATFDLAAAPRWLRVWFQSPLIDRFAYPLLVAFGYGWLDANPGAECDRAAAVARGWRIWTEGGPGPTPAVLTEIPAATLRWRRRRYALDARRHRLLRRLTLPRVIEVPGCGRVERRFFIAWRVRGPLLVIVALVGKRLSGWLEVVSGLGCAAAAELAVSYRCGGPERAGRSRHRPPDYWDDGSAGVREPRRPFPFVGADAAPLPTDAATARAT